MVSKFTRVLLLLCALSAASFAAHANVQTYNKIVVFGDSLSDTGNLFQATGIPERPYFDGRFSNGKLWVEMLANALHLDVNSPDEFADYAFGGAWAADAVNGVGGLVSLSFELKRYNGQPQTQRTDISKTLFVIWIGNNDYLQTGRFNEDAEKVTDTTINAIKTHIDALIDSGAKHFLILNLPDLGQTPKAREAIAMGHPEFASRISLLSRMHNKKLAQLLTDESSQAEHANIVFTSFNLAAYLDDLIANPEKYGMKDVINPCYPNGHGGYQPPSTRALLNRPAKIVRIHDLTVDLNNHPSLVEKHRDANDTQQQDEYCANTDDYLFWDYVHPTTRAHELIGQFVTNLLVGQINHEQS